MNEIISMLKFGALMVALVLGLSCIVMSLTTSKSGKEALQERIEYGFFGVTGLAITGLLAYAMS
uniref:hypothetical protein n=1 Tax=Ningiella ruwaisensis TaxID=2364274 RepID=UPI00109F3CDB|nr:hypothetical protein [Ningiella ruwaisensis]